MPTKPFRTRAEFLDLLVSNGVRPDEFLHLEHYEADAWLTATDAVPLGIMDPTLDAFIEAVGEAADLQRRQLSRLLRKCLDGITADDLLELRDCLRTVLTDQVRRQVAYRLERKLACMPVADAFASERRA